MNAAPEPLDSNASRNRNAVRGPEIGPALKRDVLLNRVRAARKRLSPAPNAVPRLR
jgi:hypothetical protein